MPVRNSISRRKGFTLVELMVVLVVLAILSAIAYPLYTDQTQKTRRTEGRAALLELAQAQERYYTVNGSYAVMLGSLSVDATTEHGYYNIATTGGATFTATATAAGAQTSDTYCTSMSYTNLGVKSGTGSDPSKCW
jgi:type IV pilus assembly protein PilE